MMSSICEFTMKILMYKRESWEVEKIGELDCCVIALKLILYLLWSFIASLILPWITLYRIDFIVIPFSPYKQCFPNIVCLKYNIKKIIFQHINIS